MTLDEYDTVAQFIKAVREEGVVIDDTKYFTTGEGKGTSYKRQTDDGVEDISKADVEAAWKTAVSEGSQSYGSNETDAAEAYHDSNESESIPLGTFYYSQRNWDDTQHYEELESILAELGWEITGEVDSGGYRISAVEG